MAAVTQAGDVLSIPAYKPDFENGIISFTWSQSLRDRNGTYYQVACKNVTRGNKDVLLYVQKEWYNPENAGAGEHISHFTKKNGKFLTESVPTGSSSLVSNRWPTSQIATKSLLMRASSTARRTRRVNAASSSITIRDASLTR
jgi:hypothetical protein